MSSVLVSSTAVERVDGLRTRIAEGVHTVLDDRNLRVLMIIGGRYVTFGTIYGTALYWMLGAALGAAAMAAAMLSLPPHLSAFLGAAIELVFGAVLLALKRRAA